MTFHVINLSFKLVESIELRIEKRPFTIPLFGHCQAIPAGGHYVANYGVKIRESNSARYYF